MHNQMADGVWTNIGGVWTHASEWQAGRRLRYGEAFAAGAMTPAEVRAVEGPLWTQVFSNGVEGFARDKAIDEPDEVPGTGWPPGYDGRGAWSGFSHWLAAHREELYWPAGLVAMLAGLWVLLRNGG